MLATDYLQTYPGEDDWVCIVDVCCSYSSLLSHGYDYSARWSPSRSVVAFGNNWGDVPDMPAAREPDETAVYEWVEQHPGFLLRKINAALARIEAREHNSRKLQEVYDSHGMGEVRAVFRLPDGNTQTVEHGCGIHGPMEMLRLAVSWMLAVLPAGAVLQKLDVFRKVPLYRGEKKLGKPKRKR